MSASNFGQFVEISKSNIHISLYRGFLEIYEKKEKIGRIPLDDILGLVITGYGCSHSSNVLGALAERGIPVSICGSNFLPKALVLPLVGNCKQTLRIQAQAQMSLPQQKKLWKKIVQLKLKNQAYVLKEYGLVHEGLLYLSQRVKSGDPENLEAQGARRYWKALFPENFKRDPKAEGANAMLNYSYAIIRSCVARGVIMAGLNPSLGINHCNRFNPLCLVDDLMEPFRPIGDYVVKQLISKEYNEVDKEVKGILAKIAIVDILHQSKSSPLFQVASHFITSLAMFLSQENKKWDTEWKVVWKNLKLNTLNSKPVLSA